MYWLLIGLIVLAMILLVWVGGARAEGFTTVDLAAAKAQRQQLQMEGERRYNDLGRLQTSGNTLSPDLVDAAITQPLAKPSAGVASLLTLVNSSVGLGGGALAGRGSGVEQTGAVAEKIRFCESLPLDCSKLDDPRAAECGMCHRDGLDSTGKAHRGGMYISADDIIRANEKAEGGRAFYQPTVGTCKPQNFTLMRDNCQIREAQLTCQSAGAATAANQCGQCYGAAPAGATGLLFVGPKPRVFTAVLVLSHPGMHSWQGTGTVVTMPDGSTVNVPASSRPLLDPQTVYLNNIKEGDTIGIKVFGVPMVWCAWLTSPDGNRSVGIDIGLQNESANPGLVIAGDKRSALITKAVSQLNAADGNLANTWATFQQQVPNTVMWYARRDEVLHGGILSAQYGSTGSAVMDVTSQMKGFAGAYADVTVGPSAFGSDPAPGTPKNLVLYLDNGNSFNVADGATISKDRLNNSANLSVMIPATLVDPAFPDDKADCPTGPIVFTEVGAGLMGAHSCFKPDGSFNATQYCLQELFLAAGGTQSGTGFPNTDAKVAALVKNNSLDDTVAYLNNLGSIAQYGVDTNGGMVPFSSSDPTVITVQSASQLMLGKTLSNPCDGPNAATGPQSPECLDFLWRTAGAQSMPTTDSAPGFYGYCSKGAPGAPLRADGSINEDNVGAANALGSVTAIRQAYSTLHARTQNSANFQDQNAAMQQCFGVAATPPPPKPFSCVPEVFNVCPGGGYTLTPDEAKAVCEAAGARQATPQEIQDAQTRGANWCACGWANDATSYYPMNKILPEYGYGCGNVGVNSCGPAPSWSGGKACATCYGVKPPQNNAPGVQPFNIDMQTHTYKMTSPGYDEGSGVGQTCFDSLTVAQAQAQCSANPACKSFSFAAGVPPGGTGGGCFKMDNVGFNPNPAFVGYTKQAPPPTITVWNDPTIPRIGNMITLKNAANPNGVVYNYGGTLVIQDPNTFSAADGTFNVVAANNGKDGYVSFQKYTDSNSYIRHSSFIGYVMSKDGSDIFNNHSSFVIVAALNNDPSMFSLQSFNYPDHYLMTATNPNGSIQVVLRVPGSATANASWTGVLPLVAQ
jgi:hypothetical protein